MRVSGAVSLVDCHARKGRRGQQASKFKPNSSSLHAEAAGRGVCGAGGHRAGAPQHARVPGAGRARVAGGVRRVTCAGAHTLDLQCCTGEWHECSRLVIAHKQTPMLQSSVCFNNSTGGFACHKLSIMSACHESGMVWSECCNRQKTLYRAATITCCAVDWGLRG